MDVTCQSCQARFNVPDEKIPAGKSITAACPKCKNKITIGSKATAAEAAPSPAPQSEADGYDAFEKPFDFVEEDALTALICEPDPAIREKLSQAFALMEYRVTPGGDTRNALKKMRYHNYNVIVVNELFDTSSADANGVLLFLERLPMSVRRNIFVCLLSSRYRTMDQMMAFNQSVNMIINLKNINEFGKILSTGITDNNIFYRVFKETQKSIRGL